MIEVFICKLEDVIPYFVNELLNLLGHGQGASFRPSGRSNACFDSCTHLYRRISIPFPKLQKADEAGTIASLLPKDKNAPLVFYCGGDT